MTRRHTVRVLSLVILIISIGNMSILHILFHSITILGDKHFYSCWEWENWGARDQRLIQVTYLLAGGAKLTSFCIQSLFPQGHRVFTVYHGFRTKTGKKFWSPLVLQQERQFIFTILHLGSFLTSTVMLFKAQERSMRYLLPHCATSWLLPSDDLPQSSVVGASVGDANCVY